VRKAREALQHPHDGDLSGAVATELTNSVTKPDIAENVRKLYEMAILPIHSRGQSPSP
jgi:hypothetical protein